MYYVVPQLSPSSGARLVYGGWEEVFVVAAWWQHSFIHVQHNYCVDGCSGG